MQEQKSFCISQGGLRLFFRTGRFFFSEEKKQKTFMSSAVPGYGTWPERGAQPVMF
jgi:hypothetical protein